MPDANDDRNAFDFALLGGDGVVQSGQSEILGRTPDGGFIRRVTLLNGECESKYACVLTVVLSATRMLPAATPEDFNEGLPMYALVSFGNGGAQSTQQLEVDYLNGTVFNVPAGFIRVDAVLEDYVPESNIGMNASAFMGYNALCRARTVQRTRNVGVLGAGASSAVLPIPYFAARVEALGSIAAGTYVINQYADAAGAILLAATPAAPGVSVPLVNQARYFQLVNSAVAGNDTRAIFHLAA